MFLWFLCKRSKHFFYGNIKKNQHVNMFQQAFVFPSVVSQYLEGFISLFCLQMVKEFTTSKPFLRLLYLLTISVRCLSFGNILWEKTTWEISWLITWPDLGGQWGEWCIFLPLSLILPSFLSFPLCCSVAKSRLTLCSLLDCSTPGLPVLHYPPQFAQIHVHWANDAL